MTGLQIPLSFVVPPDFPMVVIGRYRRKVDGTLWGCVGAYCPDDKHPDGYMEFAPWAECRKSKLKALLKLTIAEAAALFDFSPEPKERGE